MGKWKYIAPSKANNGMGELYNLEKDLSESKNLIGKLPSKEEELKTELNNIIDGKSSK